MKKNFRGNITPKEIGEKIKKSKNIVLTAHINPDGDALGSLLAFYFMIKKFDNKKNVQIVVDDKLPKYMRHFEDTKFILSYEKFLQENDLKNKKNDLFISLDCANE